MPFAIKPESTVLFTGDSITDAGRRDANFPLGSGYVRMTSDLILAKYPKHNLKILNTGISGHTVRDLSNRWTDDVIRYQPDWVSIMIGINDVHRWFHKVEGQSVSAEEYADLYPRILRRVTKETKAKLVLIEPFYISLETDVDTHRGNILKHLSPYQKTAEKLAKQFKAPYVRFHSMFQEHLKNHPADKFCPEPVHPNPSGHLLMAHEWLRVMGW